MKDQTFVETPKIVKVQLPVAKERLHRWTESVTRWKWWWKWPIISSDLVFRCGPDETSVVKTLH